MSGLFANYVRTSYVVVLFLMAVCIILLFDIWLGMRIAGTERKAAVNFEMAGEQRELASLIDSLSVALAFSEDLESNIQLRNRLAISVEQFEHNHDHLVEAPGELPGSLQTLYFEEPSALDRRVREYLRSAREVLALPDVALNAANPHLRNIQDNTNWMLFRLDRAVAQFTAESARTIRSLWTLGSVVNLVIILLLVAIGLLIFRPMEKRIVRERRELTAANAELASVLKHETLQRQQLSTLYQLAEQMLWVRSDVKIMQNTTDFLINTISVHCAAIFEIQQDSRLLVLRAATGMPDAMIDVDTINAGPGSKGAIMLASKQPIYSEDLQGDGWLDQLTCERDKRATQCVVVPVQIQSRPFGVIMVMSGPEYHFGTEALNYIKSLGDLLGIACDSIKTNQHIYSMQQDILKGTRISALGELGTSLAHELNQPLVAIMNYANACRRLMQSPAAGETVEQQSLTTDMLIEKLVCEAERAGDIIKHMRDYLETGELHESELDMNRVLRDSVELAKTEAEYAGVTIDCSLDPALPNARADKIQLQQVMFNLLRNAVLDTQDGASQRVTVSSRRHGEKMVEVIVADSGTGKYGDAFNGSGYVPFSAKQDEMGVGLTVCKTIIDAHGGQIWATRAMPPMTDSSAVHFTLFRE